MLHQVDWQISIYQPAQHEIPESISRQQHCCENLWVIVSKFYSPPFSHSPPSLSCRVSTLFLLLI